MSSVVVLRLYSEVNENIEMRALTWVKCLEGLQLCPPYCGRVLHDCLRDAGSYVQVLAVALL